LGAIDVLVEIHGRVRLQPFSQKLVNTNQQGAAQGPVAIAQNIT